MSKGDNPLDREVSVSVELTPTGVKGKTRSRAIAAWEGLIGNVAEPASAWLEGRAALRRAKTEGELRIIEAITDAAVTLIKSDRALAERAAETFLRSLIDRQENKEQVARRAIEDLKHDPNGDESAGSTLDPLFLNKFERHAGEASTKELQEKWGRVLAGEIRRPGTFSPKVLRVVDEIDQPTAVLFEQICESRWGNFVLRCLTGELPMPILNQLAEADLIVQPGPTGHIQPFDVSRGMSDGRDFWITTGGENGFAFVKDGPFRSPRHGPTQPIISQHEMPHLPVLLLTDAGRALATILPDKQNIAADRLGTQLATAVRPKQLHRLRKDGTGNWRIID